MNSFYLKILMGFVLALLVTCLGTALFACFFVSQGEGDYTRLYERELLTKVIALGTLPNVLIFHRLLNKNQIYKARGILLAVILVALTFAYLKFS